MPLPTKDQIDWNDPAKACSSFTTITGDQKKDCTTALTYSTCISTVNGYIANRNTEVNKQINDDQNAKYSRWQSKTGEFQKWTDRENSLRNERRPYAIDGDQGCGNDCGVGWEKYGDHAACGKNRRQIDCKRTENGIQNELPISDYRNEEPIKPSVPVISNITAKATDCCINEVNIVNSSIRNTSVNQSCVKDGATTGLTNINSSGTIKGTGSTKIIDSSITSSQEQQQYMIIAIIISIILSSSVLLLLIS